MEEEIKLFDIEIPKLQGLLAQIVAIQSEAEFKIDPTGSIAIAEVDPAHVMMIKATARANVKVTDPVSIVVGVERLEQFLKGWTRDRYVTVSMIPERSVIFHITDGLGGGLTYTQAWVTFHTSPKVPNIQSLNGFVVGGLYFRDMLHFCGQIDGKIVLSIDREGQARISSEDGDTSVKAYLSVQGALDLPIKSGYSFDYLSMLIDAIMRSQEHLGGGTIEIKFKDNYPCQIIHNQLGVEVTYLLSPRLEDA